MAQRCLHPGTPREPTLAGCSGCPCRHQSLCSPEESGAHPQLHCQLPPVTKGGHPVSTALAPEAFQATVFLKPLSSGYLHSPAGQDACPQLHCQLLPVTKNRNPVSTVLSPEAVQVALNLNSTRPGVLHSPVVCIESEFLVTMSSAQPSNTTEPTHSRHYVETFKQIDFMTLYRGDFAVGGT